MPEIIDRFAGEYSFLSNFAVSPISVQLTEAVVMAATVEHAFQALKTEDPVRQSMIITAGTARSAKQMGRRVPLRPDWDTRRMFVMHTLLKAKFADPTYKQLLLGTKDAYLIEGNTWGDSFWGMCPDGAQGYSFEAKRGYNWLGTLLMLVRSELA